MVAPRTNTGGATEPPGLWLRTTASVPASPLARLHTGVPHTMVSESLAGRSARSSRVARLDGAQGREGTARARCLGVTSVSDAAPTSFHSARGCERGMTRQGLTPKGPRSHREVVHESPAPPRGGRPHTSRPSLFLMKIGVGNRSGRAGTAKNEEQSERGGIIQSCTSGIIYS